MQSLKGLVVGTAGHIDHGKTSLVYALTGTDTDGLKEEKQRGISIDLGFAQMRLPNGPMISFVDVPGHERFVRNMLAGAAGIEAVLLIVAANESVMPQTREHFEICQLLGLRHGLVVITKCDLATPDQLAQTRRDVQQLVAGSFLAAAPVVPVSVVTKAGLDELREKLTDVASRQSERNRNGIARLPVDRSFAVKGFGTVVTGTLLAGSISTGELLELHPGNTKVRVRSLQSRHASVTQGFAGQRLAINLAGIEQHDIKRGYMLAMPGALSGTRLLDVELRWLDMDALPSVREQFILHAGTAELIVRITLHKTADQPLRFARLRLKEDVILLPGDRFVIRRPSPAQTVGGGVVLDAFPPRRISRTKTLARLEAISSADVAQRLEILLHESPAGLTLTDLIRSTGIARPPIQAALAANPNLLLATDDRVITRAWIEARRRILLTWLRDFHEASPNAGGAPLAAARLGLDAPLAAIVFKDFPAIRIQGESIALATHRAQFTQQEAAALQKIELAFRAAAFQPPAVAEVLAASGVDAKKARALLESLVKNNRLVKLPDDLVFHTDVVAHIRNSLAQHKGRRFSVAEFKGWINISRKYAIPMLEYLDQQRVTRREGEVRIVL
jgi:selenocysteine-specific elongation factor